MSNPAAGLTHAQGTVESGDGLRLFWQAWLPASPRSVLLLVHGLAEHSGRYEHVAAHFGGGGHAVYAIDYRGHGRSPGPRVHVEHVDFYLADVRALHHLAALRHRGLPAFLVGHSQGGLIALDYALRHPAGLRGLVAASPFLATHAEATPSAARLLTARLLARVRPSLLLRNRLDLSALSRDPAVGEAYARDPLVSGKVSPGWLRAVHQAQREVKARAALLALPALILAGSGDRLTDPEETRRFAESAPAELVEFVWWEGLYHELFNETVKDAVLARMESWLERQLR